MTFKESYSICYNQEDTTMLVPVHARKTNNSYSYSLYNLVLNQSNMGASDWLNHNHPRDHSTRRTRKYNFLFIVERAGSTKRGTIKMLRRCSKYFWISDKKAGE